MTKFLKNIPPAVKQFLKVYLFAIIVFTVFRITLFATETSRIDTSAINSNVLQAFIMGLRFDIVIAGYITIAPYTLLSISSFLKKTNSIAEKIVLYFLIFFFCLTFLVYAIDIPYFNYFFSHFSIGAFEWLDQPAFVLKMITQEPRHWLFILLFIVAAYTCIRLMRNVFLTSSPHLNGNIYIKIFLSICFLILILLGIRGRISHKSPIRIGTAYFSNDPFLNQLGLNPNYTLIRSYLDSRKSDNKNIHLLSDSIAIANVQKYLNIKVTDKNFPLRRNVSFDPDKSIKPNVVLVIMESMSAKNMKRHGNKNNLTPFLDSISNEGYYFENTYTAGIHTFNGIFGTLFSYPSIFRQNPMKETSMFKFPGIYSTLKRNGYSTIYFTTHDGQFDNIEGFLKANECEKVISSADYPSDQIKTTLGVPDDYMFEFSIPVLNKLHSGNKPFFATLMTTSNHLPIYIPGYFHPSVTDKKNQAIQYADFSLKKFIDLSSRQKWFKNTLFIFVADHGAKGSPIYEMSMNYVHSPLIFYSPTFIKEKKSFDCMAGQIDVFPSIMGLLKIPYENNTLGINLFEETRPFIVCNGDDKYGVIDKNWFLVVKDDETKFLYKYQTKDKTNYAKERSDIVETMNEYGKSNLQTFQYILNKSRH